MVKKFFPTFLVFFLMVFSLNVFAADASTESVNRVIAVVNNDVITTAQLAKQVVVVRAEAKMSGMKVPSDNIFREQVLQQMINEKLQLQIAKRTGIRVSQIEINAALNRIAQQNKKSLKELYDSVQKEGWTIAGFRNEVKSEITIQKLQSRNVASRITISPEEVNDFIRSHLTNVQGMPEYHLARILIAFSATPSTQEVQAAQQKANQIVQQLRKGANFQQIAAVQSKGKEALKGGDLGWQKLAELPETLAEAVVKMKVGAVSNPIQTANGFVIIKLLNARQTSFDKRYEESELQTIFLPRNSEKDNQTLPQQLLNIRQQILDGTSFSDLAKKYSQNKYAAKGGYMGWVKPGELDPVLVATISRLKAGKVSDPIATNKGWYLIKVLAKRRIAATTAAKKQEVEQLLFQRKLTENLQTFINQLRSQAYVKMMK